MKQNYSPEDVLKILVRIKGRIIGDRMLPKRLLTTNAYPENSAERERAFREVNVLNMAIDHIEEEMRKLK